MIFKATALCAALTLCAMPTLASEPEVFVHSAQVVQHGESILARVSYCGDKGNFTFALKPCAGGAECYEVEPKFQERETCQRVIIRTEVFDLARRIPINQTATLHGARETSATTSPAN